MGCQMAQGFLIGRPSPSEAIRDLLRADASRLAAGSQAV
jgi:EAL domain-containing protein (putative c-di-GMP-specific phosphodiesterase class I)